MQEFEPKIVAFVCNWCTYAGADLTGTSRTKAIDIHGYSNQQVYTEVMALLND